MIEIKDLKKAYNGVTVVDVPYLSIAAGESVGLVGNNGAGKTTCFNLITGVYQPTSGDILFNGKSIASKKPNEIAKLGICRTFQNIRLFKSLSALENVVVGAFLRHKSTLAEAMALLPRATAETEALREKARRLLDAFDLRDEAEHRASDLPYGVQRRLEIARAMATDPKLLLLDEPAAGMNPQESEELMGMIRRLRDEFGQTILLIEHDMKVVMGICEKIVVLDHGAEIAYGPPEEIRSNPKVIEAYLGEPV